jgi:hypothetical protein
MGQIHNDDDDDDDDDDGGGGGDGLLYRYEAEFFTVNFIRLLNKGLIGDTLRRFKVFFYNAL